MKSGTCCVNNKIQESIFQMHSGTALFSSEMPDTKAEDEVDFLNNPGESSISAEVAISNRAMTPEVKQGLKTQVVSGINSVGAQNIFSLLCYV